MMAMIGLNKIGAIAIPATNQLLSHDFSYRFEAAGVSAILCTADGDTANQVEIALQDYTAPMTKILVCGGTAGEESPVKRDGWHDFNSEYGMYSSHYERREDSPCGDDPLLAFFTSGTTGYPKIALHNHKYPRVTSIPPSTGTA